jgi:multidrug efflux system outer membrane protein
VARSERFPAVNVTPAVSRGRTSETVSNRLPVLDTTLYRVPIDVAYEIDFWGRVRHSVAAARAQLEGSAYAVANVRLSLAAETASAYLLARSDDREIEVLERTLKLREDALQLAERRARAGTVSDLDVLRARADLALTRADLEDSRRRRELTVNALAVLQNRYAPDFHLAARAQAPSIPEIPAGLPSQLLQRRPDVAQNERALAAASEQIGVATANFFPTIRLTGYAGVASNDVANLFERASVIWSIGPTLSLPLLDGGRNRSNFEAAQARYREALAAYRKSALMAFRETQDALSDSAFLRERGNALRQAVEDSTQTAAVSRSRYERGLVSYFEVVESERGALTNRRAEIQNDQQRSIAAVSLIKALGGGWTPDAPVPGQPVEPAPGALPPMPSALSLP